MLKGHQEFDLLPMGCKIFGPTVSNNQITNWINKWKIFSQDLTTLLIIAESRTAEIEGISAAGSTPSSRRFTAVADAELLLNGPGKNRYWNLPPLKAGVTPALISYVSSKIMGLNPKVLAVGLSQAPTFKHIRLEEPCLGPAESLLTGKAMKYERVENLWGKGMKLGLEMTKPLLLAECIAGGTTTAQAALTALGFSVDDLIGSSAKEPPFKIKKKIVESGLLAANLGECPCPKKLIAAIGDPFQAVAVGLLLGARKANQEVLLGGGSQMIALLAIALSALKPSMRKGFADGVTIATTKWLASSSSNQTAFGSLINIVSNHFNIPIMGISSGLNFSGSKYQKLIDYENGYIKEGVGAGAFSLIAQLGGISCQDLVIGCEEALETLEMSK